MEKTNLKFKNKPLSVKKHFVFSIAADWGFSIFGGIMKITQAKLKENLYYNPSTGEFIWLKTRGNRGVVGTLAGCADPHGGYRLIRINKKLYRANRLAWLYVYGYLPENDVDHINGDRLDDRIKNLREVSRQCNLRNYGNPRNNTSGVRGVVWDKNYQKWIAQIMINKVNRQIGRHVDFFEAVCHRLAAEQCLDWSLCNSLSPAKKYIDGYIECISD